MGIVRESMRSLDIIFLCTRDLMGPVENNGKREVDPLYVAETDNIFKAVSKQFQTGTSPLFPPNDSPAIIEVYGNTDERMAQVALYVTSEGTMYGEEQSIVNFDELIKMKSLLEEVKHLDLIIHRVTQTKGIMPLTDGEMQEMVHMASEGKVELVLSIGPRATTDTSASVNTPEGQRMGYRLRGQEQIVSSSALRD